LIHFYHFRVRIEYSRTGVGSFSAKYATPAASTGIVGMPGSCFFTRLCQGHRFFIINGFF
jgi:hypothetical protein